jgi:hypothetical protein
VFTPLYLDTHTEGISNDKTICPEEPVLVPTLRKKRNLVNSPEIVQKGKASDTALCGQIFIVPDHEKPGS